MLDLHQQYEHYLPDMRLGQEENQKWDIVPLLEWVL